MLKLCTSKTCMKNRQETISHALSPSMPRHLQVLISQSTLIPTLLLFCQLGRSSHQYISRRDSLSHVLYHHSAVFKPHNLHICLFDGSLPFFMSFVLIQQFLYCIAQLLLPATFFYLQLLCLQDKHFSLIPCRAPSFN